MTDSKETTSQPDFFTELKRELGDVWKAITNACSHSGISLRNGMRHLRDAKIDYVLMPIGGPLPERAPPPRSFIERQLPLPPPPLSMEVINRRLQAIADADNVKGVVFLFQGFGAGLATLQNLHRSLSRLREQGKEVILSIFGPGEYFGEIALVDGKQRSASKLPRRLCRNVHAMWGRTLSNMH